MFTNGERMNAPHLPVDVLVELKVCMRETECGGFTREQKSIKCVHCTPKDTYNKTIATAARNINITTI